MDCVFCKIIAGDIPSQKIYEDEKTFAFLDIKPVNPGHTLVLPKTHARNIFDVTEDNWAAVAETARRLAPVIQQAVGADGVNIHINNEPSAGQVVFHAHLHLIPRHEGDSLEMWRGKETPREELVAIQEKITAGM